MIGAVRLSTFHPRDAARVIDAVKRPRPVGFCWSIFVGYDTRSAGEVIVWKVLTLLLAVLAGDSAMAQGGRYVLWGAGNDTCASFVEERLRKSAHFQSQLNWIAGSLSRGNGEWRALMLKKGINSDLLKGKESIALESWLVNYCNANPLNHLGSAALALEKTLIERMAQ